MYATAKSYSFLITRHVTSLAMTYTIFLVISETDAAWKIQAWTNSAPITEGTTKH